MYCGSCLRDNALAGALLKRGHEVLLLPLYTPTRTDEANLSYPRVFFGGASVYLQQHMAFFRHSPWFLDRLWDSRLFLNFISGRAVQNSPQLLGELTVSVLQGESGKQKKEVEKLLHWVQQQGRFDVVSLPNVLLSGLAGPLKKRLDAPLICTMQGEDLFLNRLPQTQRQEAFDRIQRNAVHVDRFIAVSRFYANFMSGFLRIPSDRILVVPLGVNTHDYRPDSRQPSETFRIGYLARVAPEKGLHLLGEAYRYLRSQGKLPRARLEVAGYLGPEYRSYLKQVETQMSDAGLSGEFHYRGALDRAGKISFLQNLDVLSVPATYDEPKGLFLLEAMASGVPVVQPRRGAFPEMIETTRGGILVEPDSAESLAQGIYSLFEDRRLAQALSRNGLEGVRRHYTAELMADRLVQVCSNLQPGVRIDPGLSLAAG